ncbi:hypothetical protein SAMN06272737_1432 [Blastococcus mobilis]|uniref:Uncharacterized protein n=1 Tax=Blastococcus mobilis TaxID=1938746 RepID=A0A239AG40_9ACTN|nr:hypothetical protein SAMN06272737_1432 [Blastococcus mobilis]
MIPVESCDITPGVEHLLGREQGAHDTDVDED